MYSRSHTSLFGIHFCFWRTVGTGKQSHWLSAAITGQSCRHGSVCARGSRCSGGWKSLGDAVEYPVARAEVGRAIELSGTEEYADRPFSVLSGGEKQHIALAQALLGQPRLLILDEPLASLDPRNQMRMVECIAKIKATTGATILFIAHDVNPLLGVMDRVIYVAGGGAVIGSTDDIISSAALSKLYGTEINVVRAEGKIFIVAAEGNVTEAAHHD